MDISWVLGIVLLIIGGILFFVQRGQRQRVKSLQLARDVTVAELQRLAADIASEIGGGNWRDYVKLRGILRCDQPLVSELKQAPCIHYQMSVTREYEETVTQQNSEGQTVRETQRGSETVASNRRSVPFYLEDATGRIEVDPDGANPDTVKALEDFRPEAAGGMIAYGGFTRVVESASGDRRTLGYRYREAILPIDQRAVVVGMLSDRGGNLRVQKPTDAGHQFIISLKDEDTLAKAAESSANTAFYSMIGCFGLGGLLIAIAVLT